VEPLFWEGMTHMTAKDTELLSMNASCNLQPNFHHPMFLFACSFLEVHKEKTQISLSPLHVRMTGEDAMQMQPPNSPLNVDQKLTLPNERDRRAEKSKWRDKNICLFMQGRIAT
jgi:hypothetical protein